jgi:hypothetical protein
MPNNFIKRILVLLLAVAGMGFGQITWIKVDPLPQNDTLFSVTFGNDLFVAVGDSGTIITSPDGATWTQQHSGTTTVIRSVSYCKDRFIAVGDSGKILSSTDGKAWASIPSGSTQSLRSSTYGNGTFLIAGLGTTLTSLDGLTWVINPSVIGSSKINYVAYGNGLFAATRDTAIWTSTDGIVWTCQLAYYVVQLLPPRSFCYCGNLFIATGTNGAYGRFFVSQDGIIWNMHISGKGTIYSATYGNGQYLLITTYYGTTRIDPCGKSISSTADFTRFYESLCFEPWGWYPYSVTYGNNKFVAVGMEGRIIYGKADSLPNSVINPDNFKTSLSPLKIILSNNGISFTVPHSSLSGTLRATILTIAGNKVFSSTAGASNGNISIPLHGLSKGTYILSISDSRNRTISSPFVVARR